jgi:ABC-type glycerol-3-phosphate transport system substrate-binding protein
MLSLCRSCTRRELATSLLAGAALSLAAACRAPSAPTGAKPRSEPVSIVYGTWYTTMMENLKPYFPQFEEKHNVRLTLEITPTGPGPEGFEAKLVSQLASGAGPDVMNAQNIVHVKLFDSDVFLDLADRLKRDKIDVKRDYAHMGLEFWCGKQYAMPFDMGTRAVYYNKTLFRQAGAKDPWDDLKGQWTLDDMLQAALAVTRVTGDQSNVWGIDMSYTGIPEVNGMYVWTFGGIWADFSTMRYTLDTPPSIEAHNYIYDLVTKHRVVLPAAERAAMSRAGIATPFAAGKVAMWVRASASMGPVQREVAGRFEWDIAPFPGRTRGQWGVSLVSGNPNEVNRRSAPEKQDAAYAFVTWLAGPEVQGLFAREKFQVPTLLRMRDAFKTPPPAHASVFVDLLNYPYGIHFRHYETEQCNREYSRAMQEVFDGKAGMTETLRALNPRLNQLVQYGSCYPYAGVTVPVPPAR